MSDAAGPQGLEQAPDVAIVGAGVSGLVLARTLQRHRMSHVVLEQSAGVGGVWKSATHLQGAQVPFPYYELPEFPWPENLKIKFSSIGLPPAATVQEYVEEYAAKFKLLQSITFSSKVTQIDRLPGSPQAFRIQYEHNGEQRTQTVKNVAICTGFCHTPRELDVKGRALFKGDVIHARDLTTSNLHLAKGRHVVVIGSGKSALDASVAAAEVAASTKNVFKTAHWWVPLYLLGIRTDLLSFTRMGVSLLPWTYYNVTGIWAALHAVFKPLKLAVWRAVELVLPLQQRLPKANIPNDRIEYDVFTLGILENNSYIPATQEGRLQPVKGTIQQWTPDGLQLEDGTQVKADLVVQALGYDKPHAYLSALLFKSLEIGEDGVHLYRNIAAPNVPGLFFIGGESVSYNHPLLVAVQTEWLARLLKGEIKLPRKAEIDASIAQGKEWREGFMPLTNQRAGKTFLYQTPYNDELLKDMGENPYRKGWGFLREIWSPYTVVDYAPILSSQL